MDYGSNLIQLHNILTADICENGYSALAWICGENQRSDEVTVTHTVTACIYAEIVR